MRKLSFLTSLTLGAILASPVAAQSDSSVDCQGPYYIYFDPNSETLSPFAQAVLSSVVNAYRSCAPGSLTIAGHTDRTKDETESMVLSLMTVNSARAFLAAAGVPEAVMTSVAFGETRPAFQTEDGVSEPVNRRVEIMFGPGSGW